MELDRLRAGAGAEFGVIIITELLRSRMASPIVP